MIILREIRESEYCLLKDFLYEAIFIPEGVEPPAKEITEQPELKLYYEDFGTGRADKCIVAEDDGRVIGAVWTRIMNDYGHVDDDTPSFAISLYKEYRGKGIGTELMKRMLELLGKDGFMRASLAVQKANYAVRMYEKVGFRTVDETNEEYIMVCDLIMSRKDKAVQLFSEGMHCSQAVLAAYAEECGISEETAFKLGSCFGSGMRKGNVCGACTGALMDLGLMFGQEHIGDPDERQRSNKINDMMIDRFKQANGTCICNELLGCDIATPEGIQYARTNNLFKDFCPKMVESAVGILEEIIEEMRNGG